ncbi:Hypothetical protein SCF082_LOCUS47459 [Durusdinium trenchii]|uniref:Uncharacterized protein n=1 Tax=Durusdinium trenchii TaxID=1381693 RepID=A0ABP0RQN6_9DINO
MADQSLLIETLQAVHQHTEGVLDLLMKACNKMSLSELSTECVHQSAALKDTKKLFQTLRDAAKSSAPDQVLAEMKSYAKQQAIAESQSLETRLQSTSARTEADLKEKLKNLETRVLELDSGVETSPRKVDGQGIRKVMNRISDFEAQVAAQMQAHNQDIEKKLSFLNSRRTGDEPCEGASWSQELDAVKYDVGELKDLLSGAKSDTAHVKRIVLACERDMEDFTAAMDAVNIDLDEMRARVDSTHSIITSRQRVEATVTAEISTMRLDMGDMQEALKAHDAWMEDVSQSLQEVHERCEALNMEITQVNHGFQAKLDAKTDITSWNDMNDDVDASIRTVRDMASSLRFEVDSRRRRVDEELLRIRSEVSSLDEKINSKTTEISRDAGKASRQLEERLQARQEQCSALEATLLRHAETHQALEGQMVQQKEQLESRITGVDACMKKQGDELHKNTQDRLDLLEQQQTKVTKDTQKHLNAMDLRLAALQGATGECKRDIGKLRDEVNSLTVKSAAHDVDIARNSDELRKLERQRVEGDQRQKQEFDSIYDELDQKVSEKNFQRLEDDTSKLTRGVVKLCQVVGVFPGARMNDGTEEELDVDVEMLNWEDCAQHLTHRVEKTWRQLHSQKYRSIMELLGKKADHSVLRLLQISQQHIESQLDRVRQERELMKEVLERRAAPMQMTLPIKDPNTGMPMQGFPGWPGFGGLPVGFGPPSENSDTVKPPAKRVAPSRPPGAPSPKAAAATTPRDGKRWNRRSDRASKLEVDPRNQV